MKEHKQTKTNIKLYCNDNTDIMCFGEISNIVNITIYDNVKSRYDNSIDAAKFW